MSNEEGLALPDINILIKTIMLAHKHRPMTQSGKSDQIQAHMEIQCMVKIVSQI